MRAPTAREGFELPRDIRERKHIGSGARAQDPIGSPREPCVSKPFAAEALDAVAHDGWADAARHDKAEARRQRVAPGKEPGREVRRRDAMPALLGARELRALAYAALPTEAAAQRCTRK